MSAILGTDTDRGIADSGIPSPSLLESDYSRALAHLEKAQAERTEAVCHFLAIRAQWKREAFEDACPESSVRHLEACTGNEDDPLDQAEAEVHRAKTLYCTALEQQCLLHHLVNQLRITFQQAQENLDRLALKEREEQAR